MSKELIEKLQQVIDALKSCGVSSYDGRNGDEIEDQCYDEDLVKEALAIMQAEMDKQLPEPVGEITILGNYGVIGGPFIGVKWASGAIPSVGTKLYAEPSEINPMPDVEISKAFCDETGVSIGDTIEDAFEAGVRFGEQYHGIKEQE